MDMTNALDQLRLWPVGDQIEFVQRAWDQIELTRWQPQLTDQQKQELDRRVEAYKADPSNVLTWEEVVAHLGRPR